MINSYEKCLDFHSKTDKQLAVLCSLLLLLPPWWDSQQSWVYGGGGWGAKLTAQRAIPDVTLNYLTRN